MREEDAMESWKEKHCKLCPRCNRAIERISGCPLMVCGQNAHGGNNQSGCGQRFDWNKAQPYQRTGNVHLEALQTKAFKAPSEGAKQALWPLSTEQQLGFEQCDACRKEIVGPKFQCVDCPSVTACQDCVATSLETIHQKQGSGWPSGYVSAVSLAGPQP